MEKTDRRGNSRIPFGGGLSVQQVENWASNSFMWSQGNGKRSILHILRIRSLSPEMGFV